MVDFQQIFMNDFLFAFMHTSPVWKHAYSERKAFAFKAWFRKGLNQFRRSYLSHPCPESAWIPLKKSVLL